MADNEVNKLRTELSEALQFIDLLEKQQQQQQANSNQTSTITQFGENERLFARR